MGNGRWGFGIRDVSSDTIDIYLTIFEWIRYKPEASEDPLIEFDFIDVVLI